MNPPVVGLSLDEAADGGWWYRLSCSAVLVGAGIGWVSALAACCLAAPLSLALGPADALADDADDDL